MRCTYEPSKNLPSAVMLICKAARLPDLTRKPMLLNFISADEEYNLPYLVQVFDAAKDDDHGVAALMIIWARLCVDEGYRCNIFDNWLKCSVIASAIDRGRCDCCIAAGLHLVTIILSSYMEDFCWKIVDGVLPTLLDTLAHTPPDNLVHELCLRVIEKLAGSIYCDLKEDHAHEFMRLLVRWVPRMRHPSHALVKTVLRSLMIVTVSLQTKTKTKEDTGDTASSISVRPVQHDDVVIEFFIGVFRFGYPRARRLALRWLTHAVMEDMSNRPWHPGHLHGARAERHAALPADLRARMEKYGWELCDSVRLARCIEGFYDAFTGFTIKRDVQSLALRLFCIIIEDPRCVRFDDFFTRRAGIGKRKPRYYGVDCGTWVDILHHCATSVRALSRAELLAVIPEHLLGRRTALDVSDVFTLAHTIYTLDRTRIIQIASDIGKRKSGEPFLAYALMMFKEPSMLEKSRMRDFYSSDHPAYHHALAQSIIAKYFRLVIGAEGTALGDDGVWAEGVRNTYATRDLCQEYLEVAPPDARERCGVLEIYIALELFISGRDETDTLGTELKEVIEEWRTAVKLNEQLWGGAFRDEIGGLGEIILDRLPTATEKWREPLRRASATTHEEGTAEDFEADFDPPLERTFSKKKLLHWQRRFFAPLNGDPPLDWAEIPRKVLESFVHPTLRPLDIHECATCKLRTILVRRCGRCRAEWYCEPECQVKDWGQHKLKCVPFAR